MPTRVLGRRNHTSNLPQIRNLREVGGLTRRSVFEICCGSELSKANLLDSPRIVVHITTKDRGIPCQAGYLLSMYRLQLHTVLGSLDQNCTQDL